VSFFLKIKIQGYYSPGTHKLISGSRKIHVRDWFLLTCFFLLINTDSWVRDWDRCFFLYIETTQWIEFPITCLSTSYCFNVEWSFERTCRYLFEKEVGRSEYVLGKYHKEGSLGRWGNGERSVGVWLQACWRGEWCGHNYGKEQLHLQSRRRRLPLCHTQHTGSSSFSSFFFSLLCFVCLCVVGF